MTWSNIPIDVNKYLAAWTERELEFNRTSTQEDVDCGKDKSGENAGAFKWDVDKIGGGGRTRLPRVLAPAISDLCVRASDADMTVFWTAADKKLGPTQRCRRSVFTTALTMTSVGSFVVTSPTPGANRSPHPLKYAQYFH
jgi:hypothetical protein